MEKQSASNSKIKYTLLSILFSILFIFTVYDLTYSQFQEILGVYNGD